jgi:hypothetical protein
MPLKTLPLAVSTMGSPPGPIGGGEACSEAPGNEEPTVEICTNDFEHGVPFPRCAAADVLRAIVIHQLSAFSTLTVSHA